MITAERCHLDIGAGAGLYGDYLLATRQTDRVMSVDISDVRFRIGRDIVRDHFIAQHADINASDCLIDEQRLLGRGMLRQQLAATYADLQSRHILCIRDACDLKTSDIGQFDSVSLCFHVEGVFESCFSRIHTFLRPGGRFILRNVIDRVSPQDQKSALRFEEEIICRDYFSGIFDPASVASRFLSAQDLALHHSPLAHNPRDLPYESVFQLLY